VSTFDKQKFGQRLKEMRLKAGYERQIDLATKLGTVVQTISNYESGKRLPDAEMLSRIVDILPCNADYLLGFEDRPTYSDTYISEETLLSQKAIDALRLFVNATKKEKLGRCIQTALLSHFITSEQFLHLALLHDDCIEFVLTNELLKYDEKNDYLDDADRAMLKLFNKEISGISGIDRSNLYVFAAKQKAMELYGEFFDTAMKHVTSWLGTDDDIVIDEIENSGNRSSKSQTI